MKGFHPNTFFMSITVIDMAVMFILELTSMDFFDNKIMRV